MKYSRYTLRKGTTRTRLDTLLVQRKLVESKEKAQRLIRAGMVRVNDQVVAKPGWAYPEEVKIDIQGRLAHVSRGGEKLEEAFRVFEPDVTDRVCLDVGASTGGFTYCLLQHGARTVYAVDVGTGQLHWDLRNNPHVIVMEGLNARCLTPERFPEPPAFCTIDVSFISLTKILPAVTHVLQEKAGIVTLIKPQFEAKKGEVGRGGVIRDNALREEIVERIHAFGTKTLGLNWIGSCSSPLKGPAGNIEFLAYWQKP